MKPRKTESQIQASAYDEGYLSGYRCGVVDGWAKGFDDGVQWEAHEKMGEVSA